MMTELQQNRLEYLEETIAYYSVDPVNRRCEKHEACRYSPFNANKEGISEGCAIGRKLSPEKQLELDSYKFPTVGRVFSKLPEGLKYYGKKFLSQLQDLHDDTENWNESGLSETGKQEVERIKKEFNL